MSSGRSVIDRKRDHDQSSYTMLDVDLASKSIPVSLRLKCPVDVDVQYWRIQDVVRTSTLAPRPHPLLNSRSYGTASIFR